MKCPNCDAEMECETQELRGFDHAVRVMAYWSCPECGHIEEGRLSL